MPILIYESGKGVCIVRNASIIIPLPFIPNIVLHGSLEYEFIKLKYIMPTLIYELFDKTIFRVTSLIVVIIRNIVSFSIVWAN